MYEFCGIELNISRISINEGPSKEIPEEISNIDNDNKKKSIVKEISKKIRPKKYSVAVISEDRYFPKTFNEDLIIVISRLTYSIIQEWELENNVSVSRVSLEKKILNHFLERINPILEKRVCGKFLKNLYKINREDFEYWLKLLQNKIALQQDYRTHFKLFLTWLIKIIFKLVSEMWDMINLPKFQATILKDLKEYDFHESDKPFENIKNSDKLAEKFKMHENKKDNQKEFGSEINRYRKNPKSIVLDNFVKPVVDKYMDAVKMRQKQIKLKIGQPFITLKNKKMMEVYINRHLYDYTNVVYRIIEVETGKMLYGVSLSSVDSRWGNYKRFAEKHRNSQYILPIEEAILQAKDSGKDVDKAFIIRPIEICFDLNTLRAREDYWIQRHDTMNPTKGFNCRGGGGGSPKVILPMSLIIKYIAKGFHITEISRVLRSDYRIFVSRKTVSRGITEYFCNYYKAREGFLNPVLEGLLKEGYNSNDISTAFGTRGRNIIERLIPQIFNVESFREARRLFLIEILEDLIIKGLGQKAMADKLDGFG